MPLTKNHGGAVAVAAVAVNTVPGFLPLTQALFPHLYRVPACPPREMKFAFKIKIEPVTQAAVIIGVIAFVSCSLATIVIYVDTPLAGISCAMALVVIIYLTLRLAPC